MFERLKFLRAKWLLMNHPDDTVRGHAAETLASTGILLATPILLDRLRVPHGREFHTRQGIVIALCRLSETGASEIIDALLGVLCDKQEDSSIRRRAASCLALRGDNRVIEPLISLLGVICSDIRAKGHYVNMSDAEGSSRHWEIDQPEKDLARFGVAAVEPLRVAFQQGKDPWLRNSLVRVLGLIGGPFAKEVIKLAIDDANEQVRFQAKMSLANC